MEDKNEEVEDIDSASSDSFIDDDENYEPSTSGQDDGTCIQEPLTDQEVEELVAEFLGVESKAAEAQEALEKESLAKVESDVREELAQSLLGDDLEAAVENEMATFREEWENVLDELETESYHLLIWNHPGILLLRKGRDYIGRKDNVENVLADDCSSDENVDYNTIVGEKSGNQNDFVQGKSDDGFFQKDWWNDLLLENNYKVIEYSGKMVLLLDILVMSSDVGDKTLVFSQSIPTLDLIELYLSRLT